MMIVRGKATVTNCFTRYSCSGLDNPVLLKVMSLVNFIIHFLWRSNLNFEEANKYVFMMRGNKARQVSRSNMPHSHY